MKVIFLSVNGIIHIAVSLRSARFSHPGPGPLVTRPCANSEALPPAAPPHCMPNRYWDLPSSFLLFINTKAQNTAFIGKYCFCCCTGERNRAGRGKCLTSFLMDAQNSLVESDPEPSLSSTCTTCFRFQVQHKDQNFERLGRAAKDSAYIALSVVLDSEQTQRSRMVDQKKDRASVLFGPYNQVDILLELT